MTVLSLSEAMRGTRDISASFCLRWCQHMIQNGLHEHYIAAEIIASRNKSLYPGFSYVQQKLPFPSNCAEDDISTKFHFVWQLIRLKGWGLNVLLYTHYHLFSPMASFMWHFPHALHLTISLLQLLGSITNTKKMIDP